MPTLSLRDMLLHNLGAYRRATWIALVSTVAGILAGSVGCTANPSGGKDPLSGEAETYHQAVASAVVRDSRLDSYLRDIAKRLSTGAREKDASRQPPEPTFHLARAGRVVNAMSIGGGHVYVTTSLFERCATEEDLAACMAHAYAHVYLQHRRAMASTGAATAAEQGVALSAEQIALDCATQHRYTPDQEQQADTLAFELFARGGWDPGEFGRIYQTLLDANLVPPAAQAAMRRRVGMRDAVRLPAGARDWRERSLADETTFAEYKSRVAGAPGAGGGQDARALMLLSGLPNCMLLEDQREQRDAQERLKQQPPPIRGSEGRHGSRKGTGVTAGS